MQEARLELIFELSVTAEESFCITTANFRMKKGMASHHVPISFQNMKNNQSCKGCALINFMSSTASLKT